MSQTYNGLKSLQRGYECLIYQVSAKTQYNYGEPFLSLTRQLTDKNDLTFNIY